MGQAPSLERGQGSWYGRVDIYIGTGQATASMLLLILDCNDFMSAIDYVSSVHILSKSDDASSVLGNE
jgi:hypothetical protein